LTIELKPLFTNEQLKAIVAAWEEYQKVVPPEVEA
jgi:hypothetical protein